MTGPMHRRQLALWLGVVLWAGCGAPSTTVDAEPASLGPREKFAKFFEEFRVLCVEADSRSVSLRSDGGEGATSFRCVLDPPTFVIDERPDGALLAQVTVVTRTYFSSVARIDLTPPPLEEANELDDKSPLEEELEADPEAAVEYESLAKPDVFRDTYDFAFVDGSWRLESNEVRPDMQLRIGRALEAQQ